MSVIIYGLKTCDTCRNARKALPEAAFVDVRDDGVSATDLQRFLAAFGDDLVNRRSTTWRNLDEAARAGDPLALLTTHPTLMKRPVIDADGALTLGWTGATRTALGL